MINKNSYLPIPRVYVIIKDARTGESKTFTIYNTDVMKAYKRLKMEGRK
jgi:hypothetical protein